MSVARSISQSYPVPIHRELDGKPEEYIVHEDLMNGNLEVAGAGGGEVFDDWGDGTTVAGTSTVTHDTTQGYGGGACGKWTMDATPNQASSKYVGILEVGERYRAIFWAKASANGVKCEESQTSTVLATMTTEWARYVYEFTATSLNFGWKRNFATCANQTFWIDNVSIIKLS